MKTTWIRGIEEDKHERIKGAFNSSSEIRNRLTEICNEKIASSLSTHKTQYDGPSWAYEQADAIGYRRALEEIISLLGN